MTLSDAAATIKLPPHVESDATRRPSSSTTGRMRLHGRWLTVARAIWLVTTLATLAFFAAAIPPRFEQLTQPTAVPLTDGLRLLAGDEMALMQIGLQPSAYAAYLIAGYVIILALYLTLGLIIFRRNSNDRMAIFTSLTLLILGTFGSIWPIQYALSDQNPALFAPVQVMLSLSRILLLHFLYVFPNGQYIPRWTKWLGAGFAAFALLPIFFPTSALNPFTWSNELLMLYYVVFFSSGIYAQIYRFRNASNAIQRQQTKWTVYGIAVAFSIVLIFPAFTAALLPAVTHPGIAHVVFNLVFQTSYVVGTLIFVIALGFSVLRYRLWDIDFVINRSLIYGALTVFLALVFLASAFVIRQVINLFTNGMDSPIAFAASAVLIGALFQPARYRLRHFVDHHFYHLAIDISQFDARPRAITHPGALSGTQLGPYQVLESIGRGGMGEVYKGHQPTLNRSVAIKILSPHLADREEFRARFEREARTVASMSHPNIVHVLDFGQHDGLYYMVMDYIEGHELGTTLEHTTRLSLEETRALAHDLAAALDYAHAHGIIHRDVKAANVMLHPVTNAAHEIVGWRGVLMDFGIAKIIDAETRLTGTGIMGTLDYLAPEQIVSSREVDHRADIYALGVLLYQTLTGEFPFGAGSGGAAQVVFEHLYKPAPDPRTVMPELPASVSCAILKALSKQPEDRFQTAGELAAALQ